jgi:hypothetical protein
MRMASLGTVVKLTKTGCVDYCATFSGQLACLIQTIEPASYERDTSTLQFGLEPREVNPRVYRKRFELHTASCLGWKGVVTGKDTELIQVRFVTWGAGQLTSRTIPLHQADTFSASSTPKYIRDGSL